MENNFENDMMDIYNPIRNQAVRIWYSLLGFLLFGAIQWITTDEPGQFGLLDYWLFSLPAIPNDYELIVVFAALSIFLILLFTVTLVVDTTNMNRLLLSIYGIISTFGYFIILVFFFYLIFYRGFWSLSEFRNGFSFSPILKLLFFVGLGHYGYKAFANFYHLKRLFRQKKMNEFFEYVDKHNLNIL